MYLTKIFHKSLSKQIIFNLSVAARTPLIETSELSKILKSDSNLRIVNSSFLLPPTKGDTKSIFNKERIPGSRFFDLEEVSDKSKNLPHMLPPIDLFEKTIKNLDISKKDTIVLYDDFGITGACRGWYTFKFFGLENIYILNGGFLKWKAEKLELDSGAIQTTFRQSKPDEDYKVKIPNKLEVSDIQRAQEASWLIKNNKGIFEIVDARSKPRFYGEEKEPRAGLRSGNIEGSKNIPFKTLLNDDWTFKSNEELKKIFDEKQIDSKKFIINSCGSGMTASVLFVAEELLGYPRKSIYDGSWTEYGAQPLYDDKKIEEGLNTKVSAKFIPTHINLEAGKQYSWCSCGKSLNQPFCDGQHIGTPFKPVKFTVDKTKSYNLCRCKYTKNQPFCDLSHIRQAIGYAKKSILG